MSGTGTTTRTGVAERIWGESEVGMGRGIGMETTVMGKMGRERGLGVGIEEMESGVTRKSGSDESALFEFMKKL